MSRKDYQAIAEAILENAKVNLGDPSHVTAVAEVADSIARALARMNPRFDREKFMHAALVGK